VRTTGKFCHALQARYRGDWHDSSDHWHSDASERTPCFPVEECVVVKKQLGDDEVGASIHLGFEMIHLHQCVWCFRMTFWKSSDADSEAALIRMVARFVERLHSPNKINRVSEVRGLGGL